ncbi:Mitochondrial inner membrane protein OXA1 [Quillaja saponaria]|uniref:Mitochondrial inner membrane protein OXA1 n=1 Tax=Quillaja saponaria TaxID=32244 RepID=A0AAD7VFJ6_QUISA|nr:Mitochondrial inner membrane protein OXA1 [Quillaja saponaria]
MAFRHTLSIRRRLIAQQCHPSFGYILHGDDRKHHSPDEDLSSAGISNFLQRRLFGSSINRSTGFATDQDRTSNMLLPYSGDPFRRYMSTAVDQGSDKIEVISNVAEVLSDTTMQTLASQAPAVSEVAIAAADSYIPVKALQYFIEDVHLYTGLNWWASIVVMTLLIRGATLPLLVQQLKATSKLTIMRPRLEELRQEMEKKGMDPVAVAEGQKQMKILFKEYGVSPFTPFKGLFIQGPIFVSFFLAITNMAEKVPSFKDGGAYWFLDLTTPDNLYIFPVLAALSFLLTVECNMQQGMEGNPVGATMKNVSRGLAVLTVPFTMGFPKAIFCYWITSNLFSLMYGLVLRAPGVKKFLGVPEIPAAKPSTAPQSSFSLFPALKAATSGTKEPRSLPVEPSKQSDQRISSSPSVLSHRLRSLEKRVKGKKKNKKR